MDHETPRQPRRPKRTRRDRQHRRLAVWIATTTAAAAIGELVERLLDLLP